jgi:hypothetical protein
MTTEQIEQQTEQGPPEINTPEPPVGDQPVQLSTEEQVPGQPPEPTPIGGAASMPAQAPAPQEGQQAPPPPSPQYAPEQIAKMQQEAAQYEQIQVRAALQNQSDQYKRHLESQGYMPEQAEHAANTYMQGEQQRMDSTFKEGSLRQSSWPRSTTWGWATWRHSGSTMTLSPWNRLHNLYRLTGRETRSWQG